MTDTTVHDPIETGTVRVNDDIEIAYERRGDGPDIVLINNFFMDRKSWRSYTANLASGARLLSYDLRGQGESTPQVGEPVWEDHVTDLKALLDSLGIEKAFLLGTSFSTLICRDFAVAYPERVHGLIFAGPAMSPYGGQRLRRITKSWLKALDTGGLGVLYDQLYPLVSGDYAVETAGPTGFIGRKQNFLGIHTQESLRAGLAVSVKAPLEPELLSKVTQPTLLFVGGDDFSLGSHGAEELARLLPDSETVTVPRGGHLAFLEEPEWFQKEVVAFVSRVIGADA
ncbi:alpha/beta fold hydrolase [Streptomyces sp. NPDC059989]|uniref:alpha/beta fold hydrolase n=1 Tax=Streptomyces sp. NPDC059989 TaxID=3347026 RepID=UPI0036CF505F